MSGPFGSSQWMYLSELPPRLGARGVFAQNSAAPRERIQYITIASTGNSTDFGDALLKAGQAESQGGNGCAGGGRGIVFGGGYPAHNIIQYVTIASPGNGTDFGDMIQNNYNGGALSNGARGVHGGGDGIDESVDIIEYITIASTGNSTDFGDLLVAVGSGLAGFCDGTRGCFAGKIGPNYSETDYGIQYITVATTGNATDFGDLTVYRYSLAAVENGVRGVISSGRSGGYVNTMDYVTIASTGNATDFGDSTIAVKGRAGASNGTRGVFAGGYPVSGNNSNVMDYITIANTGNASDFGDLLEVGANMAGFSGD
jgi:hypothetical protein